MIIIIGAGLAGLVCAQILQQNEKPYLLLEQASRPGGRVGGLREDSYTFDLGFQVVLESYPAVRQFLDLPALAPRFFTSGAMIIDGGRQFRLLKPRLTDVPSLLSASTDVLTWSDKLRLALIAAGVLVRPDSEIVAPAEDVSIQTYLQGFSEHAIERFFRPFFGGVLLDNSLQTSAALLRYYLKRFVLGRAFLPAAGMQAIPDQLYAKLPPERVRLNTEVVELGFEEGRVGAVRLANGEILPCDNLVLACSAPVAARFLQRPAQTGQAVSVVYWKSARSLYPDKLLVLPAGPGRLVRHFCQLTNIAPEFAPAGVHLVSGTILRSEVSEQDLRAATAEVQSAFPGATLQHLKTICIPYATPKQPPGENRGRFYTKPTSNLWLIGDSVSQASLQGVMASGAEAARDLLHSV